MRKSSSCGSISESAARREVLQVEGRSRRHQACGRHIPHREISTIVARITKLMCVLRVTGRKFDPAKHLALSTLRPYAVFRAGDPRLASRPDGPRHEFSGFKVDVSRRSWASLVGQVADAMAFSRNIDRRSRNYDGQRKWRTSDWTFLWISGSIERRTSHSLTTFRRSWFL